MKIVFLSPRNDLSGNRKLLTMLASELGKHNSVSILYPIIPDLEFLSHLSRPTNALVYIRKYIADCRHYLKSPRWLYGSLLNGSRISVKPYWSAIPTEVFETADVVIYFTPYQALELVRMNPSNCVMVFYVMHDQSRTDAHSMDSELVRRMYRNGDHKIALSKATRRCLSEIGVHCEDVMPGGVDPSIFYPRVKPPHPNLKLLAYYSPGEPRKGAGLLLEVLESIHSQYPEISISLLTHRGVRINKYHTYSDLNEESLAEIYRCHDIFVYPSMHEGFGLPPLEAMASGCGVVATRVGAVEDYATHEYSALLCDPGNKVQLVRAIERLISSPSLLTMLKTRAVKQAQEWSWKSAGAKMDAYLKTIVTERNGLASFCG